LNVPREKKLKDDRFSAAGIPESKVKFEVYGEESG
jgi:hypothetical protein